MASETKSPGTMADDDAVGTLVWGTVDNAKASDDNDATSMGGLGSSDFPHEESIKIVKSDDTLGDENKSTGVNLPAGDTYITYGGATDLWGEAWDTADINHANFGVVFSWKEDELPSQSHYLKATNFGFSIPNGATIDGIKVEIEQMGDVLTGRAYGYVDHIRITVYYTIPADNPLIGKPLISPDIINKSIIR